MAAAPAAAPEAAPSRLLDFSQATDVALLEATVAQFYGAGSPEQVSARWRAVVRVQSSSGGARSPACNAE